ncbi:hypothetical protein MAR_033155 [Mya arenaria]|uniref:TNFR-Cys domain-containing protein n=1 Tax=Mya arenaria TaxID=6604 RepID=A0ABY7G866_MYAAR|nr:hypothetical protein MAR_033155 [Mya arenaria]
MKLLWILCLAASLGQNLLSVAGAQYRLLYLQYIPFGAVYRYQARCSLPCTGNYPPNSLQVTIMLDRMYKNFEGYNYFRVLQRSQSLIWYLNNTITMQENSAGLCTFDVQFDTLTSTGSDAGTPSGTCQIGHFTPTSCSRGDTSDQYCINVVRDHLDNCYNQTIFSQCCETCNNYRTDIEDCPFGDLDPRECTSLADNQCYNPNVRSLCCHTCHNIKQSHNQETEDCPYGDRDPTFCNSYLTNDAACYNNSVKCCDTCHWYADLEQPDCLYGNKRPEFCQGITDASCYDVNIARDCCRTCNDAKNENNQGCEYGDKNTLYCSNISRSSCYRDNVTDTCCDTCVYLGNDEMTDCKYGDRRDYCSNVTRDDCYDVTTQNDCCESCQYFQTNDCPVGEDANCWQHDASDCYRADVRQKCCQTCLQYYTDNTFLPANCKYGDRDLNCYNIVSSGGNCYDPGTEYDCCQTCAYYKVNGNPNYCRYGDKSLECNNTVSFECYEAEYRDKCCDTCSEYDQADTLGNSCAFGDRVESCYMRPAYECYEPGNRAECCKSCKTIENKNNVGCEFGDRDAECSDISPSDCYEKANTCCQSCPSLTSSLNIDYCKYGDREDCSSIQHSECVNAEVNRNCCETCYILNLHNDTYTSSTAFPTTHSGGACEDESFYCYSIPATACYNDETRCCARCESLRIDNTGIVDIKYGDRANWCSNILPRDCYDVTTQRECCLTCDNFRRNDLPDYCPYGNKLTDCYSGQYHPSECYYPERNAQCCEACYNLETGDRECEYGDKTPDCESVQNHPGRCYNYTVSQVCCGSCPDYRDSSNQGCEFGDRVNTGCYVSMCGQYSPGRLRDCCGTCEDYINNQQTTPTTEDPYPNTTEKQTSTSVGPIVGGAVGGVLFVVIVILVACFLIRRNKRDPVKAYVSNGSYPMNPGANPDPRSRPHTAPMFDNQGFTAFSNPSSASSRHPHQSAGYKAAGQPNNRNSMPAHMNGQPLHYASRQVPNNMSLPVGHAQGHMTSAAGHMSQNQQPIGQRQHRSQLQKSEKDEEVYDYIDDSDVRTVVSGPVRRPTLPSRPEGAAGTDGVYLEPLAADDYTNPSFNAEGDGDSHPYHILEKHK